MRGKPQAQPDFLTVINLNASVPADYPLRAIKRRVDQVLQKLDEQMPTATVNFVAPVAANTPDAGATAQPAAAPKPPAKKK